MASEGSDDGGARGYAHLTLCSFCKTHTLRSECFEHCHEASDGQHVPNPHGAIIGDIESDVIIIDVPCAKCGTMGSTSANIGGVMWD